MNRHTLATIALLLPAALAVTACGGGSGAEDQIATTIEQVATGHDPRDCTELETGRYVEQNTGRRGAAAVAACEAEVARGRWRARAARVSNVAVDGDKATAEVRFEGGSLGSLGSQVLEVALVEVDGGWKLDRVEGFAGYDGKALGESFARRFEEHPEGLSKAQIRCIAAEIAGASKAEAERLFLGGSSAAIVALAKGCA